MITLPPPSDGFDVAWAAGRRRLRRVRAGVGGAAMAALLTVGFLAVPGPFQASGGNDRLAAADEAGPSSTDPSTDPSADPSPSSTPSPTPASPTPGPEGLIGTIKGLLVGPSPTATDGSTATASPDPTTPSDASPDPGEPGGDPADPSSSPPGRHSYQVVRDDVAMPEGGCAPAGQPTAPWCLQFPGPFSSASGQTRTYTVRLCRVASAGPGSLQFRSSVEADFSLFDAGNNNRREWSSSTGASGVDEEHTVTVAAGRCARWSVAWDTYDDNGEILPRSTGYQLQAGVNVSSQDPLVGSDSNRFSIT